MPNAVSAECLKLKTDRENLFSFNSTAKYYQTNEVNYYQYGLFIVLCGFKSAFQKYLQ